MESDPAFLAAIVDDIRRIFHVVNEYSKSTERETGLTGPQLWAIKTIAATGRIKPSDLARRMYLHPATVVGLIDRLEVRGLVSRNRTNKDRRIIDITLTGKGAALLDLTPEVPQSILVKGLEGLSRERLSLVAEGVRELVMILGAEAVLPHLLLSSEVNLPHQEAEP